MSALLPLELLRSALRCAQEPEVELLHNLTALRVEVQHTGIDDHILKFVGGIADRAHKVPDWTTVHTHYLHLIDIGEPSALSGVTKLLEIKNNPPAFLDAAAFRIALDKYKDQVTGDSLGILIQQSNTILTTGMPVAGTRGKPASTLKGPTDALAYIELGLGRIHDQFFTGDIEGSFRIDAAEVWANYQLRKAGGFQPGVRSGFKEIDVTHDGLMAGDLGLVMGYTSQYKSTFCFNWAYHAAVYFKQNVAIIPMEMSASTLLGMLAVMHCYHPKFEDQVQGKVDVWYDDYRRGKFQPPQEQIFQDALHDLQFNPDYGQILYKEPQGGMTVADIKRWAEVEDRKQELHLLLIDYLGLVDPSSGGSSLRESSNLNATIREAKQMAKTFRNGRGIAILSPFQASREGFKEAEKNGGEYSLRALSWANEAERSSDFVYSVYTDNVLRDQLKLKWGNLKARDRKLIAGTHEVYCNPASRVIDHYEPHVRLSQNPVAAAMSGLGAAVSPSPNVANVALMP